MRRNTRNNLVLILTVGTFVFITAVVLSVYVSKNLPVKENVDADTAVFRTVELVTLAKNNVYPESIKPEYRSVSFAAVGDNIVHSTVLSDARTLAEGTEKEYDFTPMFENVADIISSADFAFINQEAPIAGASRGYSGYPMFNSPDQVVHDLAEVGFDIFNVANNHMLDKHTSGYKNTVEFFKQSGYTYVGGFENKDDYENIRVVEHDGITIALLSYTYGTNGLVLDAGTDMVVPLCDSYSNDEIDRQSAIARELADVVIVSMHWGNEHWNDNLEPSWLQEEQMQILVKNNVDVIIGSHPHTLEPMMWVDRPDGKKTLVMYSLGNFLSGMEYMRNHVGGIAGFDIVKIGEEVLVKNVSFIPTVCHFNNRVREFKIYKLSEYSDELIKKHGTQVRGTDSRRDFEYLVGLVKKTIPDEFLVEDFYK